MIRFFSICALSFGLLGACKGKEAKPAEPAEAVGDETAGAETPTGDPNLPAPVLVIKAATISIEAGENNQDGSQSIVLEDSGNVVVNGEIVATLSADGKVVDKDGEPLATLAADGTLSFPGEAETMVIAADGTVSQAGKTIASIGEDKQLLMPELTDKVSFSGPDEARRAVMVVFLTL